jgi:hypothetical protein
LKPNVELVLSIEELHHAFGSLILFLVSFRLSVVFIAEQAAIIMSNSHAYLLFGLVKQVLDLLALDFLLNQKVVIVNRNIISFWGTHWREIAKVPWVMLTCRRWLLGKQLMVVCKEA